MIDVETREGIDNDRAVPPGASPARHRNGNKCRPLPDPLRRLRWPDQANGRSVLSAIIALAESEMNLLKIQAWKSP